MDAPTAIALIIGCNTLVAVAAIIYLDKEDDDAGDD